MQWTECYQRVQLLRPKSAKLAARMLRKDRLVPSNWAFCLDLALTSRAKGAGPITQTDRQVIAANQRAFSPGPPEQLDEDQRQASEFAASIRALSVEAPARRERPQRSTGPAAHQEFIWDPRTPTPEERWLLAFSNEFGRLAHGRIDADDIAKCANEALKANGHRNPVAVAGEWVIATREGRLAAGSLTAGR